MNYFKNTFKLAIVAMALTLTVAACNQQEQKSNKKQDVKVEPAKAGQHVEIRYIDEDSVLKNYNLAKDFQEMATRLQNQGDQASKKHSEQIQNFATNAAKTAQQRINANQVTPEQVTQVPMPDGSGAYMLLADAQKYQQMMQNAQNEIAKLQQSGDNQLMQSQKQLNDSIDNFLKDYAAKNHYEKKKKKAAATLYINPSLDVTDEVIEGLNKRYTKVAKK